MGRYGETGSEDSSREKCILINQRGHMFSQVSGATTLGINGHVITVEVDISRGVTGFNIVGLAAASVKEAKERVRAAIQNSGYQFPLGR